MNYKIQKLTLATNLKGFSGLMDPDLGTALLPRLKLSSGCPSTMARARKSPPKKLEPY